MKPQVHFQRFIHTAFILIQIFNNTIIFYISNIQLFIQLFSFIKCSDDTHISIIMNITIMKISRKKYFHSTCFSVGRVYRSETVVLRFDVSIRYFPARHLFIFLQLLISERAYLHRFLNLTICWTKILQYVIILICLSLVNNEKNHAMLLIFFFFFFNALGYNSPFVHQVVYNFIFNLQVSCVM